MGWKDDAKAEYEAAREHFRGQNFGDFKNGDWFSKFISWMLSEYSQKVDAEYIKRRYPGAGPGNQAKKAISLASRYAGVAGGLSAAAVTGLEVGTIGTGGGLGPLAVAGVGAAIMSDIGATTRLQLRATYDLSVIHRAPLSLDDAEDCYLIFLNALGIKTTELAGNLAKSVGPRVVQFNVRKLLRSGLRSALFKVIQKIAGRKIAEKLTEKALLRVLVPGISIPISATANYAFTKSMLSTANRQMLRRGFMLEPLLRLFAANKDFPKLLLPQALILMMEAPKREGWEEDQMNALRQTQRFLVLSDEEVAALEGWFDRQPSEFVSTLPSMSSKEQDAFIAFLIACAALGEADHDASYATVIDQLGLGAGAADCRKRIDQARQKLG